MRWGFSPNRCPASRGDHNAERQDMTYQTVIPYTNELVTSYEYAAEAEIDHRNDSRRSWWCALQSSVGEAVASSVRNGPHPSTAGSQTVTGLSSPAAVPFGSCPRAHWPTWTSASPGAVSGTTSHPPTSRIHPHRPGVDARLREPPNKALRLSYAVSPRPLIRTARGAPAAPRGRTGPRVEGRPATSSQRYHRSRTGTQNVTWGTPAGTCDAVLLHT